MEFNLDSIKKEIEERKSGQVIMEQAFGKSGVPKTDKKRFLTDLLNSVNHGNVTTPAVAAIRAVSETTEKIHGMPRQGMTYNTPSPATTSYTPPTNYGVVNETGGDRGDNYFEQQMQRSQELLKNKSNSNAGLSQILNEHGAGQPQQSYVTEQYGSVNLNVLNEQIRKTMTEVLGGTSLDKMVESTFKNMITEMYTKEKIENVVNEFVENGKFEKIVRDVIIDLSNRKKNGK